MTRSAPYFVTVCYDCGFEFGPHYDSTGDSILADIDYEIARHHTEQTGHQLFCVAHVDPTFPVPMRAIDPHSGTWVIRRRGASVKTPGR